MPEQLQLGFLKVLKGSYMEEMIPACELLYSSSPPYEVLVHPMAFLWRYPGVKGCGRDGGSLL